MRIKAGLVFLGATCGIFSVGYAFAPPAHSLPLFNHTSAAGLSNAHCLSGDAWAVTLTITATNPELGPVADITYTGNDLKGVTVPYTHQFTTTAPSWTATAHITWSDGFTQDKGPFTATRPDGCGTPPPTSGTTTTTTCAQAIPPRSDCAPTTEVTTSPTVTASTSSAVSNAPAPSTASTVSGVAGTAAGTSIAPTRRNASPSIAPSVLPATGTGSTIVWVAVALLAVGTVAILVTVRRRRP